MALRDSRKRRDMGYDDGILRNRRIRIKCDPEVQRLDAKCCRPSWVLREKEVHVEHFVG